MSNAKVSSVNKFLNWYRERCGHPLGVNLGFKAVSELQKENAELRDMLKKSRGAISACSIQESRNDGTENRMKINALNKLVSRIDQVINKND